MKLLIKSMTILLFFSASAQEQYSIPSQKDRLLQYAGHWASSTNIETDSVLEFPDIKMICKKDIYDNSLSVTVYQKKDEEYLPILKELMGFDVISNKITAFGHNNKGDFFIGKGSFSSENEWEMQDEDLLGNQTMKVRFIFNNYTDVSLKGTNNKNETLWETRYIKANPKDKNIGIQLVSVHQQMQKDLTGTLKNLSRMGYSYVETFVYAWSHKYEGGKVFYTALGHKPGAYKNDDFIQHLLGGIYWVLNDEK